MVVAVKKYVSTSCKPIPRYRCQLYDNGKDIITVTNRKPHLKYLAKQLSNSGAIWILFIGMHLKNTLHQGSYAHPIYGDGNIYT